MEQQSKPNTGALFSGKPKVFKQGTIDINGSPQQVIVTEYENKQGETKYQIYFGVGYFNINTKKGDNEKSPDVLGNVVYNTFKYNLSAWKNKSKNGVSYLSINVKKDEGKPYESVTKTETEGDDPF